MTPSQLTRSQEIFASASALPLEDQRAYLNSVCAEDDPAVREEVDSLLAAQVASTRFLSRTAFDAIEAEGRDLPVGFSIGPYTLIELIGEGGFAVVYRAEQKEPVRRAVAIKIIKRGMDSVEVLHRFEAERQALAILDHANVARVLDAGMTPDGRPFFAMELVEGLPINRYCDQQRLNMQQRLELSMVVCRAVQHAHQKGIIHRDLKPTNILVVRQDSRDVPKVIDFGVSKALNAPLTERTRFTHRGQLLGTPAYMSPEQAGVDGLDIDTRSDIYSLGVLMYELLTGTTPIESRLLRRAAYDQMQRMIREVEPPAPSTRLSALGDDTASTAAVRAAEPRELRRIVRGEVDWIVMKCLEKDRARRYESCGALADDIMRHLSGELVQAGPASLAYRGRKFVRRHRLILSVGLLLFVCLLGALVVCMNALSHARRDRNLAEQETESSLKILRENVGWNPGRGKAVVEPFRANFKRVFATYGPDSRLTVDAEMSLGQVLVQEGEPAAGQATLESAVARARRLFGPHSDELLEALNLLNVSLNAQNKYVQACETGRQMFECLDSPMVTTEYASYFCTAWGTQLSFVGRLSESRLALLRALHLLETRSPTSFGQLIDVMRTLADDCEVLNMPEEASVWRQRAREQRRLASLKSVDPLGPFATPTTSSSGQGAGKAKSPDP